MWSNNKEEREWHGDRPPSVIQLLCEVAQGRSLASESLPRSGAKSVNPLPLSDDVLRVRLGRLRVDGTSYPGEPRAVRRPLPRLLRRGGDRQGDQ